MRNIEEFQIQDYNRLLKLPKQSQESDSFSKDIMTQNLLKDNCIENNQAQRSDHSELSSDLFYHYYLELNDIDIQNHSYHLNLGIEAQNILKQQQVQQSANIYTNGINTYQIINKFSSNTNFIDIDSKMQPNFDNKSSPLNSEKLQDNLSLNKRGIKQNFFHNNNKRKYERKSNKIGIQNNQCKENTKFSKITNGKQQFSNQKCAKSRKGKHSQSKTQKFIQFMTRYHYSKNFNQYFKKQIILKVGTIVAYENSNFSTKIDIIQQIIQELHEYNMTIHYSVEKGVFFQSFTHQQQNLIKIFFQSVIRKTYQIRLQILKKCLQNNKKSQKYKQIKFFDQKGQKQFCKIFESILRKHPFTSKLNDCDFQYRLMQACDSRQN